MQHASLKPNDVGIFVEVILRCLLCFRQKTRNPLYFEAHVVTRIVVGMFLMGETERSSMIVIAYQQLHTR